VGLNLHEYSGPFACIKTSLRAETVASEAEKKKESPVLGSASH